MCEEERVDMERFSVCEGLLEQILKSRISQIVCHGFVFQDLFLTHNLQYIPGIQNLSDLSEPNAFQVFL